MRLIISIMNETSGHSSPLHMATVALAGRGERAEELQGGEGSGIELCGFPEPCSLTELEQPALETAALCT